MELSTRWSIERAARRSIALLISAVADAALTYTVLYIGPFAACSLCIGTLSLLIGRAVSVLSQYNGHCLRLTCAVQKVDPVLEMF